MGNSFCINRNKHKSFSYIIEGTSFALNRFPNDLREVKVFNWIHNFWLFLEIKYKTETKKTDKRIDPQIDIIISLSVFQGEDSEKEKTQLFRAEWDNYSHSDKKKAQPHWHITSSQAIENIFIKHAGDLEQQSFLQLLKSEKQKVIDVKNIHFAMNADWQNKGTHWHKMDDEQQIVRWLQGMLNYLRAELERL
jgi:hypothetical protein